MDSIVINVTEQVDEITISVTEQVDSITINTSEYVLPPATLFALGGVKAGVADAGDYVTGIDENGELIFATLPSIALDGKLDTDGLNSESFLTLNQLEIDLDNLKVTIQNGGLVLTNALDGILFSDPSAGYTRTIKRFGNGFAFYDASTPYFLFSGTLCAFLTAAPQSAIAASSDNDLTRKADVDGWLSGKASSSHAHGNITNAGAIGSTPGLPVRTGASGVLQVGAFGTGAGEFCEGNDARLSDARVPIRTTTLAGSDVTVPAVDDSAGATLTSAQGFRVGGWARFDDAGNVWWMQISGISGDSISVVNTGLVTESEVIPSGVEVTYWDAPPAIEYADLVGIPSEFTPSAHGHAIEDVTGLQGELDSKQPNDSDLTAIAALAPSNDDLIQRKAGAWTNRTPAQFKTDLALVKGDVGLANVDNTSDANKPVSTATQTALDAKLNTAGMECIKFFAGDATTAVTSGTNKVRVEVTRAFTATGIRLTFVNGANGGSAFIADVNLVGTGSIMATNKLLVDASESSTATASTPPALTTTSFAVGDILEVDFDSGSGGIAPLITIFGTLT